MPQHTRGLYDKFRVERTDGRSAPGEKHAGCEYFALDLTHDPYALAAIAAYSNACALDYPQLAEDLNEKIQTMVDKHIAEAIHLKGGGI